MTHTIESIASQSAHIAEEQVRREREEAVEARILAESRANEAELRATEAERRAAQELGRAERIFDGVRAERNREIEARVNAEEDARAVKVHREILAWAASFLLLGFFGFLWFNAAWMLPHLISTMVAQIVYVFVIPGVLLSIVYLLWRFFLKNLFRPPDRASPYQGEGLENGSDSVSASDEEKSPQN